MNTNWIENRLVELRTELNNVNNRIVETQRELDRSQSVRLQIIGAITVLDEQIKADAADELAPKTETSKQ